MENILIAQRECQIFSFGHGKDAVVLWGTFPYQEKQGETILQHLQEMCPDYNFTLLIYHVDDWNSDFSPWPAEDSRGEEVFAGRGTETLHWIEDSCIPYIKDTFKMDTRIFLAGYSLAGLFSLWSYHELDCFHGVACCSGSLWMDGWEQYMNSPHRFSADGLVYLSLGGREEKTKDQKMARVGDVTRKQYKLLQAHVELKACTFEWNKGGHFTEPDIRLAKGIAWLLSH